MVAPKITIINSNQIFSAPKTHKNFSASCAGNSGNTLIGSSIYSLLHKDHEVKTRLNNVFLLEHSPEVVMATDILVLNCQDFLRAEQSYGLRDEAFDRLTNIVESVNAHPILIGLGANWFGDAKISWNELNNSIKNLILAVNKKNGHFFTRGCSTNQILNEIRASNVHTIGCPSILLKRKEIRNKTQASGFRNQPNALLTGIFANNGITHRYVLQDEPSWLKLAFGEKIELEDFDYNFQMSPDYAINVANSFVDQRADILTTAMSSVEITKNIDFTIGSRMHGAISSLINGVPAVVTNDDARSTEMCEALGIPHLPEFGFLNSKNKFGVDVDLAAVLNNYNWKAVDEKINEIKSKLTKVFKEIDLSLSSDSFSKAAARGSHDRLFRQIQDKMRHPDRIAEAKRVLQHFKNM